MLKRPLVAGAPGESPKRGCSEVHLGHANGARFIATVEPWHGTQVAVYTETTPGSLKFGPRSVIDDTLADGHALWVADIDGDHEIFAGHRGADPSSEPVLRNNSRSQSQTKNKVCHLEAARNPIS